MSQPLSLARRISDAAESAGDRPFFRFLDRGEAETACLSFAELDARARAVAAALLDQAAAETRILLVFEPGQGFVEALAGCLYAGLVGIPAPAPGRAASHSRLENIIRTSRAPLMLTSAAIAETLEAELAPDSPLRRVKILALEQLERARGTGPAPGLDLAPDRPILVQYTSGSTLHPRGVVLNSACVLANVEEMARALRLRPGREVFVNWMPHFHDMGLVGSFMLPLVLGCETVQMPPLAFVQRPVRWLEAISLCGGTMCGGPPLAFDMCVSRIPEEAVDSLDLSNWRIAFCGAEPVFEWSLDRFRRRFARTGLRAEHVFSVYGLAELTVYAAGTPPAESIEAPPTDPTARAPCFLDAGNRANLRIVGPGSEDLPDGEEGEIWLTGDSVAPGYLDEPEETGRVFHNRLVPDDGRLYVRSGDRGKLEGGALKITGRIKDVLIRAGANVAAADVERIATEGRPQLNPNGAAAFQLDGPGTPIFLFAEKERGAEAGEAELTRAIRRSVYETLGLQLDEIRILEPGVLPRTTSGKIQRAAARAAQASQAGDVS